MRSGVQLLLAAMLATSLSLASCTTDDSGSSSPGHTIEFTGSRVSYSVPDGVTSLRLIARGASGGDAETRDAAAIMRGGYGVEIDAVFDVSFGDVLVIVVGEQPQLQEAGDDGCGASGGGGSYVFLYISEQAGTLLLAAGGGGGASGFDHNEGGPVDGQDANTGENGGDSDPYLGGTSGIGEGGEGQYGGGGGGYSTPGSEDGSRGGGGRQFIGIDQLIGIDSRGGLRDNAEGCGSLAKGGFGGGGGGGYDSAAGGGGYSGGAGALRGGGGGGGSKLDDSGTGTIEIRNSHGHGSVRIIELDS